MVKDLRSYYGTPESQDGLRKAAVMVRPRGGVSKKLAHHSSGAPNFRWGGSSVGASDLSTSILFDAFGIYECKDAPNKCHCTSPWVDGTREAFSEDVISHLPTEFSLKQETITDWVFDYIQGSMEAVPV